GLPRLTRVGRRVLGSRLIGAARRGGGARLLAATAAPATPAAPRACRRCRTSLGFGACRSSSCGGRPVWLELSPPECPLGGGDARAGRHRLAHRVALPSPPEPGQRVVLLVSARASAARPTRHLPAQCVAESRSGWQKRRSSRTWREG